MSRDPEPSFTSMEVLAILNETPFPEKSLYEWRDGFVVYREELDGEL